MIIPQLTGTLTEYLSGRVDQVGDCLVNAGMTKRATYYDRSEDDGVSF